MILTTLAIVSLTGCYAVDGDTLKCEGTRYRLLAIDSAEMKGHCRRGRVCAPGDPVAAKQSLAAGMRLGPITFEQTGYDRRNKRPVGIVWAGGVNLNCRQLRARQAIYKPEYDRGGRLRHCV